MEFFINKGASEYKQCLDSSNRGWLWKCGEYLILLESHIVNINITEGDKQLEILLTPYAIMINMGTIEVDDSQG